MKISLVRTGGLIPLLKKATEEVAWSDTEIEQLVNEIKAMDQPGKTRDNTQYTLEYNGQTLPIDFEKIPEKYKDIFHRLKGNLKIVKPG